MKDLIQRLEKGFIEVDPELSIQKAFELLVDPNVKYLVLMNYGKDIFHYLTEREIKKGIKSENEVKFPLTTLLTLSRT